MSDAGRSCPLRYRYGAPALARSAPSAADTLYVVGGLYGNIHALRALRALIARDRGDVRVCFNGDFNWFNVTDADFRQINEGVLAHDAILGNVEAEFSGDEDDIGCGCAYPDTVDDAVVARSNRIHARLKTTARRHPELCAQLDALPMFRRYQVGTAVIGVVHGDADSLAGWRFDASSLRNPENTSALVADFDGAGVNIFASSHTCLPACARLDDRRLVINNGAAGMPNFSGTPHGVITRISTHPAPVTPLYGSEVAGVFVDALALSFDTDAWLTHFVSAWPPGSDAHQSYFDRMIDGPDYTPSQALI